MDFQKIVAVVQIAYWEMSVVRIGCGGKGKGILSNFYKMSPSLLPELN